MKKRFLWIVSSALALTTAFTVMASTWSVEPEVVEAAYVEEDELPVVGSYENLKKLLAKEMQQRHLYGMVRAEAETAVVAAPAAGAPAPAQDTTSAKSADYSTTNTQVQGVDEADLVKTDGTYLYQATSEQIRIVQAVPANEMKVASRIDYAGGKFQPLELYVDDYRLVVIGQSYETLATKVSAAPSAKKIARRTYDHQMVKAKVYDITNKQQPRLTRELDVEGHYLSSRKIGSSLYLVANHYIDTYGVMEDQAEPAPIYRDRAQGEEYQRMPFSEIRYFPESLAPNYLMVAGINLDDAKQKMSVHSYLGGGENMYASAENLYVAVSEHKADAPVKIFQSNSFAPAPLEEKINTTLYRFALKNGTLSFSAKGSVPGTILNQFSMDEHGGYLRIATTSGNIWRTDEGTSKNNLYVLDDELNIHGKLEGIAPGERIYSARFIGDRAYMVTFKTVDPLFVIDLKKPNAPAILGALKIPGYSDYLHPYDENHLIGFGKEAEAMKDMAYYQGMKIALFDVTDVTKPIEKFKTVIGDRGTDSELLHDHKALLFSKEKELLAFPVTVHELTKQQKAQNDIREYGHFTFQGAYLYQLNLQKGFVLKDTISHLNEEDLRKSGDYWYGSDKNIRRILTIGDTLYTVSDSIVQAQKLSSNHPLGTLALTK